VGHGDELIVTAKLILNDISRNGNLQSEISANQQVDEIVKNYPSG
jgi:hypothetical protein